MLWLESPTNPMLGIADIRALTQAAHDAGAIVVTDNTFSTPLVQQPLSLGSDVVLHSVTKYLAGHSDVVLGALPFCALGLAVEDVATAELLARKAGLIGSAR